MKRIVLFVMCLLIMAFVLGCESNKTAKEEQKKTEMNQRGLLAAQPPPRVTWSLERDNLINRFKLQNDRSAVFYMYVFIEGYPDPVGYYMVNKVSSVNSQLTNTEQIVRSYGEPNVLPSPAEDGSYGENGDAVFGFTPEGAYIEHNMHYIVSTIPLTFAKPVQRLAIISTDEARKALKATKKIVDK